MAVFWRRSNDAAPEHYATLFYGVYDAETRQVRYASAGHVPATLIRRDGAEESHGSTGTVLGLFAKLTMGEAQLALIPETACRLSPMG